MKGWSEGEEEGVNLRKVGMKVTQKKYETIVTIISKHMTDVNEPRWWVLMYSLARLNTDIVQMLVFNSHNNNHN